MLVAFWLSNRVTNRLISMLFSLKSHNLHINFSIKSEDHRRSFLIFFLSLFQCSQSTESNLILRNVERFASGEFSCEILEDYPLFTKKNKTAKMTVYGKLKSP